MKKIHSIWRAALIILCCFVAGFALGYVGSLLFGGKNGTFTVTFCETTDTHGAYFDSLYTGGVANESSYANVSSYLKQIRSEGVDPVVIDAGDNLQGDNAAYYYNYVNTGEKHLISRIFDYLKYDAVIVGNHDIEPGPGVYDKIKKEIGIPYLASNAVNCAAPDSGKAHFQEYTIVKRDGVKIAVIGMTNANIKSWLSEEKWEGIDFVRISDVAQSVVDKVIKKAKPHIVVLAVHSGKGNGEPDVENEALYLARTLRGVDLVLYGHDHQPVAMLADNPEGQVPLLNAGTRNLSVARCDLTVTLKHGKVVSRSIEDTIVSMAGYEPDLEYINEFRPSYEEVKGFATSKIGTLSEDLDFGGALEGPTPFISLVHAVQLEATGADISITAPLSTTGGVSKGVVTFQDLASIYRFENTLNKVVMTGRQIKDYLECSYDRWIKGEGPAYNYDSAEGIVYDVVKSAEKGSRVNILSLASGEAFDLDREYTVAMNSYRSSGGGNLLRDGAGINPQELQVVGKYKDIRSLIGDYITEHKDICPVAAANWKFVK